MKIILCAHFTVSDQITIIYNNYHNLMWKKYSAAHKNVIIELEYK